MSVELEPETENGVQNAETETETVTKKRSTNAVRIMDAYLDDDEDDDDVELKSEPKGLQIVTSTDDNLEDNTSFMLEHLDKTKGKKSTAKSMMHFWKPKIVTTVQLSSRALALLDMATDINLLYKAQANENSILTVCLFLSLFAPYLLQYSCGIKLFTLNRTFDRLKGLKKILVVLFLMPCGVLFFIFLDVFDVFFNFYLVFQLFFCCASLTDIQRVEEDIATQLGMDRMNWEGIKRQKKVSQLMFETIPQVSLQILMFSEIIPGLELTSGITQQDILLSACSAISNAVLEIIKLYIESKAVEEGFFNYALTCFMARVGWVPFRSRIRTFLENPNSKLAYISFHIRHMFVSVDFFFSTLTIQELIETLYIRPIKKDGYDSVIIIDFHQSLRLLGVHSLVELMRTCAERHIFIKGLNDVDKVSWNDAVFESMEDGTDVRIISNSRDSQGTAHLMSIYKSEKALFEAWASKQQFLKELIKEKNPQSKDKDFLNIAFLPTVFSQCIPLDFDVNVSSLQTGETLVFELIRHNDYVNLWYLLNEYQTETNCDVYLDTRNKKGKSPLYYALKQYIGPKQKEAAQRQKSHTPQIVNTPRGDEIELETMRSQDDIDTKLYMLLLKSKADANFPVLKRGGLTQSCLGYLLDQEELEIMLEVIRFGAELNSKEIIKLAPLFLPQSIAESMDVWKQRKSLLIKICGKLKLPLDYIRNEHQCNPIHLIMRNEKFYNHPKLSFIIKELQNTSLIWMFQKDEFGNLPVVGILREHNPNINVFKMVYDNAPTDYHRQRLVTILGSNRYSLGILIYFIVTETRKLVHFISCKENKNIRNELKVIFDIFGRNIRWNAKDHSRVQIHDDQDIHHRIENKVDLSIVSVLNEGGLYLDDYMRYKIATKLRNEFNLKVDKAEEVMIQKWNRNANKRSLFSIATTRKLKDTEALEQKPNVSTEIKTWLGHIDKQMVKQKTQRQRPIQKFDTNIMDITIEEIKEEKTEDIEEKTYGTIISLGDTTRLKTKKQVEDTTFKAIFWKRIELVYAFIVEGLSVMDLSSDIVILLQLLRSNNQWWTAWMILFLLSPYLVSFCALASIFQSHDVINGRPQMNRFVIVIFLSPLSLLFLMILDVVFMFYIIFALIFTLPLLMCCCNVSCVDSDWIFKLFGMTHMETKGYRRLRTLSQLLFETLPQILLQLRMLYALQIEGIADELSVTTSAVMFSVVIASIHFVLEVMTISAEASATKVTLFQYGINCLNARLNWVPLSHLLVRHHRDYQQRQRQKALKKKKSKKKKIVMSTQDYNVLNFESLTHRVCRVTYVVNFEFSSSAMRRLAGYVTRMQKYVDISSDDVKQIAALLPVEYCMIPRIILGEKSCLNLNLSDLSVLYRNGAHRILIEGGNTLDWYYFVRRHFRKKTDKKKTVGFEEETEFDWKKAQFLLYDFLLHGELDAVHYIYQEIEDVGAQMMSLVPVQTLKRNLLLAQNNGGIVKDIATLRRFWKNKYMFGLSCTEAHQIYDVILRYYSKALTLYQSMNASQRQRIEGGHSLDDEYSKQENSTLADQYQGILNMILLILWYSQSTMVNHRCPQCNIGWREYIDERIKSQYRINLMKQLPEMVKIFVKKIEVDRSGIFGQNKKIETTITPRTIIPFILCECSDRFATKIDDFILKDATHVGCKVFDFEGVEEGDEEDIERFTWSWLDIEGKDSTGTYLEYERQVNDEINEKIEIALSDKPHSRLMQKQKTMEEEKILQKKQHEKSINIRLMKGKFGSDEYKMMAGSGDYYLKIDQSVTPWRYYEIFINKYGVEISSKTKIVRRITEENSINMVILQDSKSVSDKILANLNQRNIDMLSTVIQSKHDATSSYAIMKNLYQQNLITDLLSCAVSLKLRHGYDQFLVAISRFFRKKTVSESDGHTGYYQKVDKITYTFPYRDIEDNSGLTVLGIESLSIILRVKTEEVDDFPEFQELNSLIPHVDTALSQQRDMDNITLPTTALEKREIISIALWMKIPKLDAAMLDDWNNVLITKQELYKADLKKAIKFECNLQHYYALGYFNPSLKGSNVDKSVKFYIETSRELNIETVQSKVRYIVNQSISESRFERVNNQFAKEHNVSSWQYYFDGKWINYEQITCIQIDDDLKQLLKQRKQNDVNPVKTIIIPLKSGSYFNQSQNKQTYQIRIVLAQYPPRIYQLNVKTGHTRHVKQNPPFWLSLDEFTSFDESIYQDPYKIGWKYQCQRVTQDKDDDEDDKNESNFIYLDIITDLEEKENELSLQERIESAYQQRLKRFKFNNGFSERTIHFNYNSIPYTFIETDNNPISHSAEMRKVIRQESLFLRRKGLDQDLTIKNGPYWELITPCSMEQYNELMMNARTADDDAFFDSFVEDTHKSQSIRCSLCECNLERWEILGHQLSSKGNNNNTFKLKQIYQDAVSSVSIKKPYNSLCERINHNTIVSIASNCYFHAGCISQHFENELINNATVLKCPKTDKVVYDSAENELIGSPINGKYAMIVNENEKTKQIQILFVFNQLISPITHAIKMDDNQLLQDYRDSFRRRLIRLKDDEIVYVGGDAKLIQIFNKALPRKRESTKSKDTVDAVVLQKTVTYDTYNEEDDDDADIAGMIDNELDLSEENNNKDHLDVIGTDEKVALLIIESDDGKESNDDKDDDTKQVKLPEKTVIVINDDNEKNDD